MNSTFRARLLASSEVISQAPFTSEEKQNDFCRYIANKVTLWSASYSARVVYAKTSVSVKVVDIYHAASRLAAR